MLVKTCSVPACDCSCYVYDGRLCPPCGHSSSRHSSSVGIDSPLFLVHDLGASQVLTEHPLIWTALVLFCDVCGV